MSDPIVVPLVSMRRAYVQLLQKLQHVIPAVPLLMQGANRLMHEAHGWSLLLGIAEMTTSALVIGAFIRAVRGVRGTKHAAVTPGDEHAHAGAAHHIDWVDLFLGAMLGIEAWAHWAETGHIKRPTILLALIMVALGVYHGRLAAFGTRRRSLRIDDAGVSAGGGFLSRFAFRWSEIAAIEIDDRAARIVGTNRRVRTINLRDLKNAAEVRSALDTARARIAPPPEPAVDDTPTPDETLPAPVDRPNV